MPTDPDPAPRRPRRGIDPLAEGITDGVHAGYQAVEYVLEGLRESLGVRAVSSRRRLGDGVARAERPAPVEDRRPARPARSARAEGRPAPARAIVSRDVIDDLAYLLAEVLDRAGEVAQDVAQTITEQGPDEREGPAGPAVIALEGGPDQERAEATFTFWNTTAGRLTDVRMVAPELTGPEGSIPDEAVTFDPEGADAVPPGASVEFAVRVRLGGVTPGVYRGLAQSQPGGAYVVLELTVAGPA